MPNVLSLSEATRKAREFFEAQCGSRPLTFWHVLGATESLEKGVYVIRCGEHCFLEQERRHEVWIDPQTGAIVHTHRLEIPPGHSP